jgi:hypothetical protein
MWEQFLAKLEGSTPRIRAIGITDYYSVDTYVAVRKHKQAGRLSDVDLVFANVEMRYGIGTSKGSPINVHLLVSPEDPDHAPDPAFLTRTHLRGLWRNLPL